MRLSLIASILLTFASIVFADNAQSEKSSDVADQKHISQKHTVQKPVVDVSPIENPTLEVLTIEHNIIAKTNAERKRNGLAALTCDTSLLKSARRHCNWMARSRSMQHTSAVVAENIAMGQSSSTEVVRDWMNSPGHRANILNRAHTRIGVAAYRARNGQVYWCQQFLQ
ncbi:MAG: hypothetical protein KDB27_06870 [Planctomycetales bacterium]|nr:hypothetical protein [Planctomycetales bacterium]